jgi:hypothetical protein
MVNTNKFEQYNTNQFFAAVKELHMEYSCQEKLRTIEVKHIWREKPWNHSGSLGFLAKEASR